MYVMCAEKKVAKGERLWGCQQCDYDRCERCVNERCGNKDIVEFTDTDGDKVVLKRSGDHRIGWYVNGKLEKSHVISIEVRDHTIHVDEATAGSWAEATVRSGQEYILKQSLDLFAEAAVPCEEYQ